MVRETRRVYGSMKPNICPPGHMTPEIIIADICLLARVKVL